MFKYTPDQQQKIISINQQKMINLAVTWLNKTILTKYYTLDVTYYHSNKKLPSIRLIPKQNINEKDIDRTPRTGDIEEMA